MAERVAHSQVVTDLFAEGNLLALERLDGLGRQAAAEVDVHITPRGLRVAHGPRDLDLSSALVESGVANERALPLEAYLLLMRREAELYVEIKGSNYEKAVEAVEALFELLGEISTYTHSAEGHLLGNHPGLTVISHSVEAIRRARALLDEANLENDRVRLGLFWSSTAERASESGASETQPTHAADYGWSEGGGGWLEAGLDIAAGCGCEVFSTHQGSINERLVEKAGEKGLVVMAFGLDEARHADRIQALESVGVIPLVDVAADTLE